MILKIFIFVLIFILVKNLIIIFLSKKIEHEIEKKALEEDFNLVEKIKSPLK